MVVFIILVFMVFSLVVVVSWEVVGISVIYMFLKVFGFFGVEVFVRFYGILVFGILVLVFMLLEIIVVLVIFVVLIMIILIELVIG